MVVIKSMGRWKRWTCHGVRMHRRLGGTPSITDAHVVRFLYLEALRDVSVYE
jgi:hypothetical protein